MPQSWRAYGLKADSRLLPLILSRIPTFYQARVKCRSAIMPGAFTPASSPLQLDRVRFHDESLERKQNFMEHGLYEYHIFANGELPNVAKQP